MEVRWIEPDATLGVQRGEVVVCIPVYGAHELFVRCLQSVLKHTPSEVRLLICDDASPDPRTVEFVRRLEDERDSARELVYLRRERNLGFPANVNGAFAIAAPADVVVLNSDCAVAAGWLDRLREAAYVDTRVATATTLTNHGTLVSVPERGPTAGLPEDWTLEEAAAAVAEQSLRIRPRLPTAIGHCLWVRRSALELVGDFDLAFSPGYGEEVDFSQRCRRNGLSHVLADDVLVLHHGGSSFQRNGKPLPVQLEHERLLAVRYPYYHQEVQTLEADVTGPLARALGAARRALKGMSVLIDARILSGPMTGTQLQVLEVIAALARTRGVHLRVLVPDELTDYAADALQGMPDVSLLTRAEVSEGRHERVDVVHRPYQINTDEDVAFLATLGERLIVTNQDLIGYHNPSYFRSGEKWEGYRRLTRGALAVADHVVFISRHAMADALAEDLVEPGRASAIHNGVDHSLSSGVGAPHAPRGMAPVPDQAEMILCLGTDFRHKNRVFALRLLAQLQERHGWDGYLVLAGPHVTHGSSAANEAELVALRPGLAKRLIDVAAVSEREKAWLLRRASLVLYPTVHEGFGLVPFEAADHGTPCMWAPATSLQEILPPDAASIVPWDAAQTAERALELMRDRAAAERNVAAVRTAGEELTWDRTAAQLLEVYKETCASAATPASSIERRHGIMSGPLSEDAMRLLGPGGALPPDVERPLLALATHPQFGKPMFRAIKLGYRASFRLRRLRGNGGS